MAKSNPLVLGFSFTTYPLSRYKYSRNTRLSNLAGFPQIPVLVYAVEENYLQETFVRFYNPTETSSQFSYNKTTNGKSDVVQSLYHDAGRAKLPLEADGIKIPEDVLSGEATPEEMNRTTTSYIDYVDVIVSEATRTIASVDTSTALKMVVNYNLPDGNRASNIYLAKARAMVQTFPGFFFSSYKATALYSVVLVSMDSYYRLMEDIYYGATTREDPFPEKPPKLALRVKLKDGATQLEREAVANGLRNFIKDDLTRLLDTTDLVTSTAMAINILNLFFNLVSVIAVVLCFFVLWLSFTANVNENSWEFGVLRAVGLNANRVIRMYIYEALCLIASSVVIGSFIGLMVSITLTLQFNLFTELPFTFDFPYVLFFSVFAMSIGVAVIGSYMPSVQLKKKDIAIALKNM
eukprot:TRINITY_DN8356_c0_g1_i2.p1 TRINITY_DN8356_c0_g1~~TRINITY_DN8356_c0_g1_i2.p1  ORF type:complete len:428 (+),score=120.56 TRINITY_DN8356_c0_g1_i2:64-1284(+)